MRGKRRFYLLVMGAAAGLYVLNLCVLKAVAPPGLQYFCVCYLNDVAAGAFLLAFVDFWLTLWGFRPLAPFWKQALLLLCAGAVWEFGPMLWKLSGVFDLWDFPAYLAGGGAYWLLGRVLSGGKEGVHGDGALK